MGISLVCAVVAGLVFGIAVASFARPLLGLYITDSHDAIEFGVQRMMVGVLPYFLCSIMEQFAGLLRGVGKSLIPAVNTVIGTCLFRLVWVFFIFPLNRSVLWLYTCYPISWALCSLMHLVTFMIIRKNTMKKMMEQ